MPACPQVATAGTITPPRSKTVSGPARSRHRSASSWARSPSLWQAQTSAIANVAADQITLDLAAPGLGLCCLRRLLCAERTAADQGSGRPAMDNSLHFPAAAASKGWASRLWSFKVAQDHRLWAKSWVPIAHRQLFATAFTPPCKLQHDQVFVRTSHNSAELCRDLTNSTVDAGCSAVLLLLTPGLSQKLSCQGCSACGLQLSQSPGSICDVLLGSKLQAAGSG